MEQCVMCKRDKGINDAFITFIPFPKPAGSGGDKGINPYKVYPVSPCRFAETPE